VGLYFHDTEREESHRWTLAHLLAMVERYRPAQDGGPDRTFVIGGKREYLGVSTVGPDHFKGQHPLWGENRKFEGAMIFDGLSFDDVQQITQKFYAGHRAEGCFAPHHGRFQFYVPPKAILPRMPVSGGGVGPIMSPEDLDGLIAYEGNTAPGPSRKGKGRRRK
jgi:hypothetical protein